MLFRVLAFIASAARRALSFPRRSKRSRIKNRIEAPKVNRLALYFLTLLAIGAIVFAITNGLVGRELWGQAVGCLVLD
jgi:hypothetical protein